MNEIELVQKARGGDREAFGELAEAYSGPLSALAYDRLGTVAEAQDAVQEALVASFRQIRELGSDEAFGAWLYSILRNICGMRIRAKGVDRRALDVVAQKRAGDQPLTPLEKVEKDEQSMRLRRAVEELSAPLREVVVMRFIGGAGRAQAAEMLELSLDALDKRMERALRQLRERLG
jgi:RNA polymerase sigma-70 factor (ECF subfamily)